MPEVASSHRGTSFWDTDEISGFLNSTVDAYCHLDLLAHNWLMVWARVVWAYMYRTVGCWQVFSITGVGRKCHQASNESETEKIHTVCCHYLHRGFFPPPVPVLSVLSYTSHPDSIS